MPEGKQVDLSGSSGKKGGSNMLGNMLMLVVVTAIWIGFGAALILDPTRIESIWSWFGNLPMLAKGVVTIVFLPWVAGLWVWETNWPIAPRIVLVAGLTCATVVMFLPRAIRG